MTSAYDQLENFLFSNSESKWELAFAGNGRNCPLSEGGRDRNVCDWASLPQTWCFINPVIYSIHNPLAGLSKETILEHIDQFASKYKLEDFVDGLRKGALVSPKPSGIRTTCRIERERKANPPRRAHTPLETAQSTRVDDHT